MEHSLYLKMKTETKWILLKRFVTLIGLASGGLGGFALYHKDLALLVASISLGVGAAGFSALIGFVDALSKDFEKILEKLQIE